MGRLAAEWTLIALLLAFRYGTEAALLRHSSSKINADYSLRLENFNNVQYSAPLSVGGQTLPVIYDTGSFEILVLSKKCLSCEARHAVYDQGKSTTFVANTPDIVTEHLFGSGPVVSEKGFESISMGDQQSPYNVGKMPFWQVLRHEIAVWDENAHFSGIVGLGHPTRIPEGFAAPGTRDVTMLAAMGVRSFAICLERHGLGAPGWLVVGPRVSAMPTTGFFRPVPVVGQTHWGVQMSGFSVPGIVRPDPCVPSCGAIIDSGTSLIAAPPAALPIIRQLSSMVAKDCSNLHALPVLKFRLGNQEVELPPKAYVMKIRKKVTVKQKNYWGNVFQPKEVVEEKCVPAFMTISKNSQHGPVWILGMPFLRYYYTVFDRISKQIFISEASPNCQPQPSGAAGGLLFNASRAMNGTHGASLGTRFSAEDFEPNELDPNEVRVPLWATEESNATMPF